jgi:hypothetical protein
MTADAVHVLLHAAAFGVYVVHGRACLCACTVHGACDQASDWLPGRSSGATPVHRVSAIVPLIMQLHAVHGI